MPRTVERKADSFTQCAISQFADTQERYHFIQAWVLGGLSADQAHPMLASSLDLYIKFMHILPS